MQVMPYLFFEGRCEEALDFYAKAVGAKIGAMMRFKEAPEPAECGGDGPPAGIDPEKVMHADFTVGDSMVMASDGMCSGKPTFGGVSLSLSAKDPAEAAKLFKALSEGGNVQMPMGPTFFAPAFGMVADKFGVSWMVIAMPEEAPK
jgi:PhnB protein